MKYEAYKEVMKDIAVKLMSAHVTLKPKDFPKEAKRLARQAEKTYNKFVREALK